MPASNSDLFVQLSDGTSIAVSLQLPEGNGPFPVLASFYPYRKDDFIGASSAHARDYLAQAGYATLLVDIRGYGASTGPSFQAWDPREAVDGAEIVQWAAAQPWCDGQVGIWGSSYGAAQALGIAAERPPALKAIASIYGAADIYEDFVFPGGCPNGLGASAWSAFVLALELAPPGLQDAEGRWRDAWNDRLHRLESGNISSLAWPAHATHDAYWLDRVIDVERIEVPSFFLSGWRDLLCRGTLESYRRCKAPKQLLAGPWSHSAPETSIDAPYDSMLELRRWFDKWMKNVDEDPQRPAVVYRLQGSESWHGCTEWPPANAGPIPLYAGAADRAVAQPEPLAKDCATSPLVGTQAGLWFPMGVAFGDVLDQALDDARSACFTGDPLAEPLLLLGTARAHLELELRCDSPAHVCVKLCDVAPDGKVVLITSGWRRIDIADQPRASIEVELYPTAYRMAAGHRLRWTVATADFPRIWPSAAQPDLVLHSDAIHPSYIDLPVASDGQAGDIYTPPSPASGINRAPWVTAARPIYAIDRDVAGDRHAISAGMALEIRLPQGGRFSLVHSVKAEMSAAKPGAAVIRTEAKLDIELASGETFLIETAGTSAIGRRHLEGRIACEGARLFDRRWSSFNGKPGPT